MTAYASHLYALCVLAVLAALVACGEAPEPAPAAAEPDRYVVRGIVEKLPSDGSPLQVHHERIPDFRSVSGEVVGMDEMVMPFPLAEGVELGGVKPGDKVEIVLEVSWTGDRPYEATSITPLDPATPLELSADHAGH